MYSFESSQRALFTNGVHSCLIVINVLENGQVPETRRTESISIVVLIATACTVFDKGVVDYFKFTPIILSRLLKIEYEHFEVGF